MSRESLLGAMTNRVKTDVRLPKKLVGAVEAVCEALGVPKNAFFVLSSAVFSAMVLPLVSPGKRRVVLLKEIEVEFQRLLAEARKAA